MHIKKQTHTHTSTRNKLRRRISAPNMNDVAATQLAALPIHYEQDWEGEGGVERRLGEREGKGERGATKGTRADGLGVKVEKDRGRGRGERRGNFSARWCPHMRHAVIPVPSGNRIQARGLRTRTRQASQPAELRNSRATARASLFDTIVVREASAKGLLMGVWCRGWCYCRHTYTTIMGALSVTPTTSQIPPFSQGALIHSHEVATRMQLIMK